MRLLVLIMIGFLLPIMGQCAPITNQNGQKIYEAHCVVCHKDGLAGAPRFHNQADWQERIKQKKLDELISSAINGINAMPPKGTCNDCSEHDIQDAIQFMLPKHD